MGLGNEPKNIIYQGEDKVLVLSIQQKFSYGDTEPYDLTGVTEIVAIFPTTLACNSTQAPIVKRYTTGQIAIITAGAGKFSITINGSDSLQFPVTPNLPIEIRFVKNGLTRYSELTDVLAVGKTLYQSVPTIAAAPVTTPATPPSTGTGS